MRDIATSPFMWCLRKIFWLKIFPSFCSKSILCIVWDGYWKINKVVGAYLEILYLDNFYLRGHMLAPLLMLLRLPPSLLEGNFVAFTSSNIDVSWHLSAMLIDTNCRFAVGYEFCLLRWITCSLVRLIQYNIWVASDYRKKFLSSQYIEVGPFNWIISNLI